jgi:pimeloyl-ACP methyl ester carboxylesterase
MMVGSSSRFGDGKPIILVPQHLGSDLALLPLAHWLKALGYRPATAGFLLNLGDSSGDRLLARSIDEITARVGRKAVLVTYSSGLPLALRAAEGQRENVSDVVVFGAPYRSTAANSVRTHFISSGWSVLPGVAELPRLLRSIGLELIEAPALTTPPVTER